MAANLVNKLKKFWTTAMSSPPLKKEAFALIPGKPQTQKLECTEKTSIKLELAWNYNTCYYTNRALREHIYLTDHFMILSVNINN